MPRGGWQRKWIKLFTSGWLHGSIRWQLDAAERGTFADLLALAGECGHEGKICDNDGRPLPREYIAGQLNIPQTLLDTTIAKCKREGRISNNDDVLVITNWKSYQSEYARQKPYRNANKAGKRIAKVCPECGYKAVTDETYCPKCSGEIELKKDYTGGRYGHMVQH